LPRSLSSFVVRESIKRNADATGVFG
jgi:hypothetical protein